ncbi:MAG: glycosyltransferase, partial [Planctomycetaceae bacterium]|nr:glycosyltransferase [Planctomycetaceae bacterium]
ASGLVLPSLWEGMPNVVLEAMAAGLPVVATQVEGVDELVLPQKTGLIVAPHSAESLADGIETLLEDPQRAAIMGQAAQDRARTAFSWEKTVAEYDALYSRLLARPRSGLIVK